MNPIKYFCQQGDVEEHVNLHVYSVCMCAYTVYYYYIKYLNVPIILWHCVRITLNVCMV